MKLRVMSSSHTQPKANKSGVVTSWWIGRFAIPTPDGGECSGKFFLDAGAVKVAELRPGYYEAGVTFEENREGQIVLRVNSIESAAK